MTTPESLLEILISVLLLVIRRAYETVENETMNGNHNEEDHPLNCCRGNRWRPKMVVNGTGPRDTESSNSEFSADERNDQYLLSVFVRDSR